MAGRLPLPASSGAARGVQHVAPSAAAARQGLGFVVSRQYPHAGWTSWMNYDHTRTPTSVFNDTDIVPNSDRSINLFVIGNPMLATPRNLRCRSNSRPDM
jgi:hypothetical protein